MNICEHLSRTAGLFPEHRALVFEGSEYTYRKIDQLSSSAAQRLIELGVVPGDRVALMLSNVPAFVIWYYASLRIGAIALTISHRLVDQEVAHVLNDSKPTVFVAEEGIIEKMSQRLSVVTVKPVRVTEEGLSCNGQKLVGEHMESTWVDVDPEVPAAILYTSGTTGVAKGVTLSHRNVRSNVNAFNHLCGMVTEDRILLSVPMSHCFGQNALLNSALNVGATLILQRSFDLVEAKRLIATERVSKLFGVPTMFQLLLASCQPEDLKSVKYCFSAAATLPIQVSQAWQKKFGQPIYEGYGLTETSPFASYNHRLKYRIGSIGSPIDAVEMRIVDVQAGEPCPTGELGEIVIRGPNVMLGYWNRPEETAESLRNGWFHSGDIGRCDEYGFFYLVDRIKDMISVGGLKVYPAEVESALLDHLAVSQVAVVGKLDEMFGERVVAFVVLSSEERPSEELAERIQQHAKSCLAAYKVPRQIAFIGELPRNPSGKVLKRKLRDLPIDSLENLQQEQTGAKPTTAQVPRSGMDNGAPSLFEQLECEYEANRPKVALAYLQSMVQELTDSDREPSAESRFLDAGLDSLMIVEISTRLQAELGPSQNLPATLVFDYPRLCDLADFLVGLYNGSQIKDLHASKKESIDNSVSASVVEQQVEELSEQEALRELMRELETL